ncbi:zinc-ribbon domain-containing protein [Leifsonia shinshuensis]|uniref:Treble clef zinc finger domain-containing protein n=1 Tax=Leifsonia shinshuensis TaxID=150026 RepID=A0A853D4N4_9MICO|nr:hypothetical protein [Leifsonia shinshuensis]
MPRSVQRQLPLRIAPHDYETVESFTTRLCRENNLEVKVEAIAAEIRKHDNIPIGAARRRLACEFGGLREESDAFLSPLRHDDGSECSRCRMGLEDRWVCRLCSNGEAIEQVPHFGPFVCAIHRLWIAPGVRPEDHALISADHSTADACLQKLVEAQRVNGSLYREVTRIARYWAACSGRRSRDVDVFPQAVFALHLITDERLITTICDRSRTYAESHGLLHAAVAAAITENPAVITDRLWLLLRPVLRAVHETLMGLACPKSGPHDLFPGAHDLLRSVGLAPVARPLEPFSRTIDMLHSMPSDRLHAEIISRAIRPPVTQTIDEIDEETTVPIDFICPTGHRYQSSVRVLSAALHKGNSGCPYCGPRARPYPGETSLAMRAPNVAADWDWDRNPELNPDTVGLGAVLVHWKCRSGHGRSQTVSQRVRRGCVECKRRPDFESLSFTAHNPVASAQFRPELNDGKTLDGVRAFSTQVFTWQCELGHLWSVACSSRSKGNGCPICRNRVLLVGFNDLQSREPSVAKDWDYERNNGLTPKDVIYCSSKLRHWRCSRGHRYSASPASRSRDVTGCPYCSGSRVDGSTTSLRARFPEVARQLHPYLNSFAADEVTAGSQKSAIFACDAGHLYIRVIHTRTRRGLGCTVCA